LIDSSRDRLDQLGSEALDRVHTSLCVLPDESAALLDQMCTNAAFPGGLDGDHWYRRPIEVVENPAAGSAPYYDDGAHRDAQ
jgi:hypothetical protein